LLCGKSIVEVYYDLTICHTASASYADMTAEEVFAAAVDRKTAKYVTSGMIARDSFCVLPVTAVGYLGKTVTDLLKDVAKAMWEDLSNLQNRIAALVQLGNGKRRACEGSYFLGYFRSVLYSHNINGTEKKG
jgi:hypothetical protein